MPEANEESDPTYPGADRPADSWESDRVPMVRKLPRSPAYIVVVVSGYMLLLCAIPLGIFLLIEAMGNVRHAANRMKSSGQLSQIGWAIHNYNDANSELPGNTYSPDGTPLLSWRVHLLPFIEQDELYRQFKLDEPWDGPNNIRLIDRMPKSYSNPNEPRGSKTFYRGFSSPGAVFERRVTARNKPPELNIFGFPVLGLSGTNKFDLNSFKDLISETIMVVDAGEPVEWTKPDDLDASPGKPLPSLGGMKWAKNKMQLLMADGYARMIRTDLPEETLRALITHSGQESLPANWEN